MRADENGTRAVTTPGGKALLPQPRKNRLSGAVRLAFVRQIEQCLLDPMLIRIIRQWDDTVEHDAAVGDGTGLIKVQAVHTGKRLHGLEFLHQRVPSCQSDCGKREIQRGEQHQASGIMPTTPATAETTAERHWPVVTAVSQPPTA